MTVTWKVKSTGKIKALIIYLVLLSIGYVLFPWFGEASLPDDLLAFYLWAPLVMLPITLAVIILSIKWYNNKKVVSEISTDTATNSFEIRYKRKNLYKAPLEVTAYSVDQEIFYCVLIIYKKIKASRGHMLYKPVESVMAMELPWQNRILGSMAKEMGENGLELHKPKKKKSFWIVFME